MLGAVSKQKVVNKISTKYVDEGLIKISSRYQPKLWSKIFQDYDKHLSIVDGLTNAGVIINLSNGTIYDCHNIKEIKDNPAFIMVLIPSKNNFYIFKKLSNDYVVHRIPKMNQPVQIIYKSPYKKKIVFHVKKQLDFGFNVFLLSKKILCHYVDDSGAPKHVLNFMKCQFCQNVYPGNGVILSKFYRCCLVCFIISRNYTYKNNGDNNDYKTKIWFGTCNLNINIDNKSFYICNSKQMDHVKNYAKDYQWRYYYKQKYVIFYIFILFYIYINHLNIYIMFLNIYIILF